MIFEYDENNLDKFENFKGGEKYIEAKMYFDGLNRFMIWTYSNWWKCWRTCS